MVLNGPSFAFFLCFMALILPKLQADIEGFDEVWHKRVEEAEKTAIEAYEPNPEKVTKHFNQQVRKVIEGTNGTRRYLKSKKNKGPCETTNPIDNCWRCKADWEQNRKQLAKCVLGFGHKTRGGVDGRIYVVTDASDDSMENPKPGTLRHACVQKEPLWIIFARSMVFRLENELLVASHKTIDARGANVHIAYGAGITIQFAQNVIIHGLHIHDVIASNGGMIRDTAEHCGFRTAADGDGVSIFQSTNVWLDHLSMSNCKDGLIDVIQGSTAITISNCHFTHHNDVMLFGASDTYERDKIMQITLAFNHFGKGLVQRMPRIRWGLVHIVNNDYTHWLMYAIGGSSGPTVISHGNRFIAPINNAAKEVTKRDYATEQVWRSWLWRSEGDLMMNGAIFVQSGDPAAMKFPFSKMDMIQAMPGTFVSHLTRFAGSLNCIPGTPC